MSEAKTSAKAETEVHSTASSRSGFVIPALGLLMLAVLIAANMKC